MKEIKAIIAAYNKLKHSPEKLALATVIEVEGSSYRRTGARMLIRENGEYIGGISGGCIEGDALRKAFLSIAEGKARLVTYDTSNENEAQIGVSLGCNGIIHVLIAPLDLQDENNPVEQLVRCSEARAANVLLTVITAKNDSGLMAGQVIRYQSDKALSVDFGNTNIEGLIADIRTVNDEQKSVIQEYDSLKVFIEYVPPEIKLVIMGGNYDVYPLVKLTGNLGWQCTVVANANRLHNSIKERATVTENLEDVVIDEFTVAIVMSHDYNADFNNLKKALDSSLRYIGLLGPKKRLHDMLDELDERQTALVNDRVFGPAGLDIGASQPEEIAVSIIAEILSVLRERPGSSLKDREGPIYNR